MSVVRPAGAKSVPQILLVEDELMIALGMEDEIMAAGFEVIGPCSTVETALACIENTKIDAGIVDLRIQDRFSYEVAARLEQLGIPWAITTGYPAGAVDPRFAHVPVLAKPCAPGVIADALRELLGAQ